MPPPQPAHKFSVIFPAALRDDLATAASFERLLAGGCTEKNLVQLAELEYQLETGQNEVFAERRKELDSLNSHLSSWASRLQKLADEIDEVGRRKLKIEGYETVAEAIFNIPRETPLRDRSFEQGSDSLVLPAESLRLKMLAADFDAVRESLSWRHGNRRITDHFYTVIFWHYCCQGRLDGDKGRLEEDAGGLLAKAHEIAGRKNSADPGSWLRMRVTRFQKNAPGEYSKLEEFVNNYVRGTRTGEPTLMTEITRINLLLEQKSRQK
jgi:hypothetical protein